METATNLLATPAKQRDEAWTASAWEAAGRLRQTGQRRRAEDLEDACERVELAADGKVPRASRIDAKPTDGELVGRVVANAIRDGFGLTWALRYAGISRPRHDEWSERNPDYRRELEGLDLHALPEDARPDGGNKS